MKLRIVCVLYKNENDFENLLNSIAANVRTETEIVLWNNSDHREQIGRYIRTNTSFPHKIHVFGDGNNIGFAKAANAAAKQRTGEDFEFLLFINPDSLITSEIKPPHLEEVKASPGLYGLRVFDNPEKTKRQANARNFPKLLTSIAGREGLLTRAFPNNRLSSTYLGSALADDQTTKVDWVSGSAMLTTHQIWEKIEGYDDRYFLYCEDVDLGRKAQKLDIPAFYYPFIDVVHAIKGSSENSKHLADFYHHSGMWKYYLKWTPSYLKLLSPLVLIGIWSRYLLRRVLK